MRALCTRHIFDKLRAFNLALLAVGYVYRMKGMLIAGKLLPVLTVVRCAPFKYHPSQWLIIPPVTHQSAECPLVT